MSKKIILPFILLCVHNGFAQPTITQAQFVLNIGDLLVSYPQSYSAPSEGPAQVWDYTALNVSSPSNVNVIDDNFTSLSGLPPSTLCTVSPTQEDCFLIDATGMQRTGLGGSGISIPYQNHEYLFEFPITYGDSIVDTYHSNYMVGSMQGIRTGITTVQVVGYGTLQLPGSVTINNAMLVRTHELQTDSVNVGTWSVTQFDMVSHYFYAAGQHGYILLMVSGTANPGGPVSTGWYNELQSGAGIKTVDISNQFEMYPNPATEKLMMNTHGNISLMGYTYEIMNMQGAIMTTGIINTDNLLFDVGQYAPGLYMLNIRGENFNVPKRFIKQ